jgi:phenylpyruvate tautomerase
MPLINLYSSAPSPAPEATRKLLTALSSLLSRELGKPESYVMTNLVPRAEMTFGGTFDPVCYAEIKNIGKFKPDQTKRLSSQVCDLVSQGLGVPSSRIYIEFADASGYLWGFDGGTFG